MADPETPPEIRTMEEFAAFVGLSRPTVSRYFHEPTSVRKSTQAKIRRAVEASGFRPNLFAVNLKRRRTRILGIIIPNSTDPFYMGLAARIEELATDAGYFAFMLSSNGMAEMEAEAIDRMQSMNIAGAILVPLGSGQASKQLAGLERRIPIVYVDNAPDNDGPYVGTDNAQSFGLMVDYLCRSGEPPTYLGMPEINRNAILRREAYVQAMERAGEAPRLLPLPDTLTWNFEQFGHDVAAACLPGLPTRTLLCANDRVALGAQLAAWEAGLRIGHGNGADLRIAGHDDHPLSRFSCPPLTTVAQNLGSIAACAMAQLMDRLASDETEAGPIGDRILFRGDLIIRASA